MTNIKTAVVSETTVNADDVPRITRTPFQLMYDKENVPAIEFNPAWNNGTGYFDGAIKGPDAVQLRIGHIAKSISPEPNNRKLLFVGTRYGTVCLFQRYTDSYATIVKHLPDGVNRLYIPGIDGALSTDMQSFILGPWGENNIGNWIEDIAKRLAPEPESPVVAEPHDFEGVMTIKDLKEIVKNWPEVNQDNDPTEVWVQTEGGLSSPVKSVWPLNRRELGSGREVADILFYHNPD